MSRFASVVVLLLPLLVSNALPSHSLSGPHITDVNILLPPRMTHPVEYRLQGSDGCFECGHCTTSARLKSSAPYSGRKETSLYATDIHTGMVIHCKVYIDHFSRIQIFHNSVKLDFDGLATLHVQTFDNEVFHSTPNAKEMKQDICFYQCFVKRSGYISGSATALFVGGFSILEMDKNSMQLNLTPDANRSIITIVGNTDVELHWREWDQLVINPFHREDLGIGGHARYEVKSLGSKKFTDKVILTLTANGQRMEMDVNYKPGGKAALETTTNVTLWAGILGCLILLILTAPVFICYLDRPDRSWPSTAPAMLTVAPVIPDRRSPVVVNGHSPRTPQPFTEYMKTIDETLYYRREGRRLSGQNML